MEHTGEVVARHNGLTVIECHACEYKHLQPLPTEDELAEYYGKKFYQQRVGTAKDPFRRYREDLSWWTGIYREIFKQYQWDEEDCRVLDFGSGPGFFLDYGRRQGWKCYGVEPSPLAREHTTSLSEEITVFDNLDAVALDKFHAINCYEVIEHLPEPVATLSRLYALLEQGGVISVCVPNDFSPLQERAGGRHWVHREHLNYFNFESLENLLIRVGFSVVRRTTLFPMEFFTLLGWPYVGDDIAGRACHHRRVLFDSILSDTRWELYDYLAQGGFGRECIVFGVK